ncbi:MAG: ComEC/Rec2 family competence protein [Minisyncoccia bacterium]
MMEQGANIKLNFLKFINSRHSGVFVFIWSFILAVLVSSYIFITPIYSLVIICVGLVGSIIYIFIRNRVSILFLIISLIILGFGVGGMRYAVKDFHESDLYLEVNIDKKVSIKGLVVSEPEHRENDVRVVVDTEVDKILVSTGLFSGVNYGDEVEVMGKLEQPGLIDSDVGRPFDYGAYLSKENIYYTVSFAQINILESGRGNKIKSILFRIKNSFTNKMNELLAEPESSLLAGLLVSGKQALPKDILDEFRRAGVVHIVVLSGYNITIVAEFLKKIFSFLSLRLATVASIFGIIFFTIMTGATATVVRAAIMVLIVIFGKSMGRTYSVPRALLTAGFFMLLENPKILVFDASFQLSFLAVLALVYVEPIVLKYLTKIPEKYGIRSILSTTIATQFTVLPFLLYSMGNFSIVSIFSNMLILMFVPITMLVGFTATAFGFISYHLALPFSYITHIFLIWILGVAHTLGNLSFAQISIRNFPQSLMLALYLSLIVFIYKKNKLSR